MLGMLLGSAIWYGPTSVGEPGARRGVARIAVVLTVACVEAPWRVITYRVLPSPPAPRSAT